mgnify:CR=1 FL=1
MNNTGPGCGVVRRFGVAAAAIFALATISQRARRCRWPALLRYPRQKHAADGLTTCGPTRRWGWWPRTGIPWRRLHGGGFHGGGFHGGGFRGGGFHGGGFRAGGFAVHGGGYRYGGFHRFHHGGYRYAHRPLSSTGIITSIGGSIRTVVLLSNYYYLPPLPDHLDLLWTAQDLPLSAVVAPSLPVLVSRTAGCEMKQAPARAPGVHRVMSDAINPSP